MDFSALYTQYGGMTEPSYTLKVNGTKLGVGEDVRLLRAVCELTCRQDAGYLLVEAVMDPEGENGSAWLGAFQAGASCSLSLGYGSAQTEVFRGFLYEVTWDDPLTQGPLGLEALFLDVRGRLMASACADAGSARTLSELLQAILGQSCCTQLTDSRKIAEIPEGWDLPVRRSGETDYEVLCGVASFLCYEFYAYAGALYFGPPRPDSSSAVTFDGPIGLSRFQRCRTLAGQCAAVTVSGTDDRGERIRARNPRDEDSGFGTDQMGGAISGDLCQPEAAVHTMAQAQYLSKARMKERQRRAGGAFGTCLGLPELRPGRFIQVSGLSQAANGTYYVHTVRHTLDENGYETCFEAED